MFKLIKISILLLFFINLTACSYSPVSLKEIYNEIPSELADDLKDPLNPTAEQNAMIDDYVQHLMQWHRRNKLPEYSQSFAKLALLVRQEQITSPQLQVALKQIEGIPHFDQATHLSYKMLAVAKSLTNQQITQLDKSLKDEFRIESLEIKSEKYTDEVNDSIKMVLRIIGINLNAEQINLVKQETKKLHDIRNLELQAEKQWSNQMITLLKQSKLPQHQAPYFESRFVQLWNSQHQMLKGSALQLDKQNTETMKHLIRQLIMSFEPEQKVDLSKQLTSISRTFSEMANE